MCGIRHPWLDKAWVFYDDGLARDGRHRCSERGEEKDELETAAISIAKLIALIVTDPVHRNLSDGPMLEEMSAILDPPRLTCIHCDDLYGLAL